MSRGFRGGGGLGAGRHWVGTSALSLAGCGLQPVGLLLGGPRLSACKHRAVGASGCKSADHAPVGGGWRPVSASAVLAGSRACALVRAGGAAGSPHPEAQALPLRARPGQMFPATYMDTHAAAPRAQSTRGSDRWCWSLRGVVSPGAGQASPLKALAGDLGPRTFPPGIGVGTWVGVQEVEAFLEVAGRASRPRNWSFQRCRLRIHIPRPCALEGWVGPGSLHYERGPGCDGCRRSAGRCERPPGSCRGRRVEGGRASGAEQGGCPGWRSGGRSQPGASLSQGPREDRRSPSPHSARPAWPRRAPHCLGAGGPGLPLKLSPRHLPGGSSAFSTPRSLLRFQSLGKSLGELFTARAQPAATI